jgi:hypothetical protein
MPKMRSQEGQKLFTAKAAEEGREGRKEALSNNRLREELLH